MRSEPGIGIEIAGDGGGGGLLVFDQRDTPGLTYTFTNRFSALAWRMDDRHAARKRASLMPPPRLRSLLKTRGLEVGRDGLNRYCLNILVDR